MLASLVEKNLINATGGADDLCYCALFAVLRRTGGGAPAALELIDALLAAGARRISPTRMAELATAVLGTRTKTLVKLNPAINAIANDGSTPLHAAVAERTFIKVVQLLLEKGAILNQAKGNSIVYRSVHRGEKEPRRWWSGC